MHRTTARRGISTLAVLLGVATQSAAGPADVVTAVARCQGERCRFDVTVRHADSGWDHYADGYEVLSDDGEVLATRVLRHPHVDEQPFTRSLPAEIPANVKRVRIRAHDSVHGHGGREQSLELER
jgi:hypothetical protein